MKTIRHLVAAFSFAALATFSISYPSSALATSFTPVQSQVFRLSGGGITTNAVTITVTTFKTPAGANLTMSDFGDIGYFVLEPGTSKEENGSFSGVTQNSNGTATLTGVSRGLGFVTPYTASSTLTFPHAGATQLILTNSAVFYSQFAKLLQSAYIQGQWIFASSSVPTASGTVTYGPGDGGKLVTFQQLASTSFSGSVNASESINGLVQLGTKAQTAAGTSVGSTAARLVPPGSIFSATASATTTVPVTGTGGTLASGFIDQTANYSWTGTSTFTGPVVFTGPTVNVFTSSTTYTKPANVRYIRVRLVAAGGNGGACATGVTGGDYGPGGGGAGYSERIIPASLMTATSSVVVGTATTSFVTDARGGSSSFGAFLSATGGAVNANERTGGLPGVGTGGDINASGNGGQSVVSGNAGSTNGGAGGGSLLGGGAAATSTTNATGTTAGNYGGGGSGGNCTGSTQSFNGGAGAPGVVIVEEYYL